MNPESKLPLLRRTVRGWHVAALALIVAVVPSVLYSQQKTDPKPNILVIMGDDIGWFNPSCHNRGMMGYQTPNIDRIGVMMGIYSPFGWVDGRLFLLNKTTRESTSGGGGLKSCGCQSSSICSPIRSNGVIHPSSTTNGSSIMPT